MKVNSSLINQYNVKESPAFKGFAENPKYIPEIVGKAGKIAGEYVSVPEQKLFLAATALMFVPLIDLKFCEEDKKVDSAIKSASKAIVGGLTGVAIRGGFMALTKKFIGFGKDKFKIQRYLYPEKATALYEMSPSYAKMQMNKYTTTLATLFAIIFMTLFSNKNVDVPLTSDLQDFMGGIIKDKKTWTKSLKDVTDNRKVKIANWFEKKKKSLQTKADKIYRIIRIINNKDKDYKVKEQTK